VPIKFNNFSKTFLAYLERNFEMRKMYVEIGGSLNWIASLFYNKVEKMEVKLYIILFSNHVGDS